MSQWFEMSTGSLVVGEAAYAERLEQVPPGDLVPLAELLLGKTSLEGATKAPVGTYESRVSTDELEAYGAWLLKIISTEDKDAVLKTPILHRAHDLGLGIRTESIMQRFGTLNELRTRIGRPSYAPWGTFENWSTEDYVENARKLSLLIGNRKPEELDYRQWAKTGKGPGPRVIRSFFKGGLTRLNTYLGFPDISSFEYEDYIDWGVRVMRANEGRQLGIIPLAALSRRGCGPSEKSIYNNFDGIPTFTALVAERYAYDEARREEHTTGLLSQYEKLEIPPSTILDDLSVERKAQFMARYNVASYCLPGVSREQLLTISKNSPNTFTTAIQRLNPELTAGHIEVVAETLGVFDDIWEMYPNDIRLLKISEKELEAEHAKKRVTNRNRKSRNKKNAIALPNASAA